MSEVQLAVGVKVFIQNNQGEYLMLKRSQPYEGDSECKWDIPGGRLIPGEEQLVAARREVLEETKLNLLSLNRIVGVQDILRVPGKHTVRITYVGSVEDGEIVLDPKEHTEYKWLSLANAKKTFHDIFLDPVFDAL